MTMPPNWEITPVGVLVVAIGIAYAVGVRNLAARQTPAHQYRWWHRSLAFDAALVVLLFVVSGPLERWGMQWLSVHMVVHVIEMFYLPPLILLGAPRVPLLFALPLGARHRLLSAYYRGRRSAPLRSVVAAVAHPVTALALFNAVMVFWHVPAVFDWAEWHGWVMNWLMAPSFLLSGLLFWRIILPSHPSPPRGSARFQALAIVVTAFEMLVLAMAMAIFTKTPWYSMNVEMNGVARSLRDQHWAAGILWVCGDFWAVPAMVLVLQRVYTREGGLSAALDRALGRV